MASSRRSRARRALSAGGAPRSSATCAARPRAPTRLATTRMPARAARRAASGWPAGATAAGAPAARAARARSAPAASARAVHRAAPASSAATTAVEGPAACVTMQTRALGRLASRGSARRTLRSTATMGIHAPRTSAAWRGASTSPWPVAARPTRSAATAGAWVEPVCPTPPGPTTLARQTSRTLDHRAQMQPRRARPAEETRAAAPRAPRGGRSRRRRSCCWSCGACGNARHASGRRNRHLAAAHRRRHRPGHRRARARGLPGGDHGRLRDEPPAGPGGGGRPPTRGDSAPLIVLTGGGRYFFVPSALNRWARMSSLLSPHAIQVTTNPPVASPATAGLKVGLKVLTPIGPPSLLPSGLNR